MKRKAKKLQSRPGALTLVTSIVSMMFAPPLAFAADAESDDRTGFYIGLGGSYGIDMKLEDSLDPIADSDADIGGIDVKGSGGVDSHFGYRFHKFAAVEAQLEYLPSFDVDVRPEGELSSNSVVEYQMLSAGANLKLIFWPMGTIEPFGIFGVGALWAKADSSIPGSLGEESDAAFAIRGGGGVDIYVVEQFNVSLSATYVKPFGDFEDTLDYLSVGFGVQYHF